jgi:hypothetical protein
LAGSFHQFTVMASMLTDRPGKSAGFNRNRSGRGAVRSLPGASAQFQHKRRVDVKVKPVFKQASISAWF